MVFANSDVSAETRLPSLFYIVEEKINSVVK